MENSGRQEKGVGGGMAPLNGTGGNFEVHARRLDEQIFVPRSPPSALRLRVKMPYRQMGGSQMNLKINSNIIEIGCTFQG